MKESNDAPLLFPPVADNVVTTCLIAINGYLSIRICTRANIEKCKSDSMKRWGGRSLLIKTETGSL